MFHSPSNKELVWGAGLFCDEIWTGASLSIDAYPALTDESCNFRT